MLYFSKGGNIIKYFKNFDSLFIVAITLLFIYDYFPTVPFASAIPMGVVIFLILGSLLFNFVLKKYNETDLKTEVIWKIIIILYVLFLLWLFPLLGGQSVSGISFSDGGLYIIILISLFDIYSKWKKLKVNHSEA